MIDREPIYSREPADTKSYLEESQRFYTQFAFFYDHLIKILPTWKRWITPAIQHIEGPRVLEVSFGTGYLLTRYADKYETYGVDYNPKLAFIAKRI